MACLSWYFEDVGKTLQFTVLEKGATYDLVNATQVDLIIDGVGSFTCSITTASAGEVEYVLQSGDFAVGDVGEHDCRIKVTEGTDIFHTDDFIIEILES